MTEAHSGVPSQIPDCPLNKASSVTAKEKQRRPLDTATRIQKNMFATFERGGYVYQKKLQNYEHKIDMYDEGS